MCLEMSKQKQKNIKKRGLQCRQTGTVARALTQLGWGLDAACSRRGVDEGNEGSHCMGDGNENKCQQMETI